MLPKTGQKALENLGLTCDQVLSWKLSEKSGIVTFEVKWTTKDPNPAPEREASPRTRPQNYGRPTGRNAVRPQQVLGQSRPRTDKSRNAKYRSRLRLLEYQRSQLDRGHRDPRKWSHGQDAPKQGADPAEGSQAPVKEPMTKDTPGQRNENPPTVQ